MPASITMTAEQRILIIGAGEAGGTAVQTLRDEGFEGGITLVGAEGHLPYERPALSKSMLRGGEYTSEGSLRDQAWYHDQDVDVRLDCRAVAVDRTARRVRLDDGDAPPYDKVLIATGAQPRRLRAPGADLPGVFLLRTLEDSRALAQALHASSQVVVVGAGWIGLEAAAASRAQGCAVTVVDPNPVPLAASMGTAMGTFFADVHREHGVTFLLGHHVTGFRGSGWVEAVTVDDGRELPAQVVVVGVGVAPDTALFEPDDLAADHGVRVDTAMRTRNPDVFAGGDIASVANPLYGRRIRVEHWANALMDGRVAAQAMLGRAAEFDPAPFFFTDQYDLSMEYAGWVDARTAAPPVIRGDLAAPAFHAFWLDGDIVVAGLHVNSWDEGIEPVQDLIRRQVHIDPARLADPSLPLAALTEPQGSSSGGARRCRDP